MDDQGEQKPPLGNQSENESETSESSAETETTQVSSKKSKSRRISMQTRILSRLTKLMEQMFTKTRGTNRHRTRRRAGSNSSTEELTDTSSLDSEVLLNLQDNSTEPEPPLHENTRNDVPQSTTEPLVEQASASNIEQNHVKQNRTSNSEPRTQQNFTTRPNIMPDKYDGSTDWADYETHFDSCQTINNWSDAQAVRYLSACLRGPALRLLNERRQTEWTYNDLKSKLAMRFSSSKQAESYLLELRGRKRRPNESLQELGRNIRELTTKAYPGFDLDGIDRLAKMHFSDAIQNPEIRTGIFHSKAKSLDEMIAAAITTETFLLTESQRSWRKNTHNRVVEVEQTSQRDLQRNIDLAVEKAVRQAMSQQNDERNPRTNQNKQPRTIVCFYCNKPGHSETNCFRKQSDLRQEAHNPSRTDRTQHFENSRQTRQSNELRPPMRATERPRPQ